MAKASKKKSAEQEESIISYKGFDARMQCRGYQFEIGKEYVHDGEVEACAGGFHACEYPLDVFNYYAPGSSKFALVEQRGDLSRHDEDSKVASRSISIKAEISIPALITAAFEFVRSRCEPATSEHATGNSSASSATGDRSASSATGDRSASSATGNSSASSATGYSSASSATGYRSASSATGNSSASSATGYSSASSATGDRSASSATGNSSASSATGNSSASSATGYSSASSATGDRSASSATGNSSASSATGDSSASSATGDSSASSATGNSSASSATGDSSASSATGYRSASSATGNRSASLTTGWCSSSEIKPDLTGKSLHAVAIAVGGASKARAPAGSAITLCYRNDDGELIHIRSSKVGDNGIKPDTWYSLNESCEFVEAQTWPQS